MVEPATTALGGPDGSWGPHAFVDDLDAPVLGAGDRHHFERVLRLRVGDPLTVSDGAGRWRPCRFGEVLAVVGDVRDERLRVPPLTIGFAPVKGDRPEWVVQKATELGIDRLVVLRTERSVVRWDGDRATRQLVRLAKVAREAAMQSRRCRVPTIEGVMDLESVASTPGLARADQGGGPLGSGCSMVVIGPEGGWSDGERRLVPVAVGLGDHVLRSETAAVVAAAHLTAARAQRG